MKKIICTCASNLLMNICDSGEVKLRKAWIKVTLNLKVMFTLRTGAVSTKNLKNFKSHL